MSFTCEFCHKQFSRESTILAHSCEPRRRRLTRDEPASRLGFQAYLRFYEITQGSARLKTFDDFCNSPYYRAFVRFGKYCTDIKAINPARFVDWLLKHNKKIDHWCSDTVYTEYLIDYVRIEHVNDALARSIEYSIDWSERTGHPSHDCLRYGNHNAIVHAITTGRISAWALYNCESGQKLLSELDSTQISIVWPYVDSEYWAQRFHDYMADQAYAQEILTQAGW